MGAARRVRRRRRTSCSASAASTRSSTRRRCRSRRPQRIAVEHPQQPFARIRVEGYFAVTSNTVQFGARAELFFGFDDFSVEGHLGFDALFQFSPFYFIVDDLGVAVAQGVRRRPVQRPRLRLTLEGPDAVARAGHRLDLAAVLRHRRRLRRHLGRERATPTLPPIAVAAAAGRASSSKRESWRALLPAGAQPAGLAAHARPEPRTTLVLHPVGVAAGQPARGAARPHARQGRQRRSRPTPSASRSRSTRRRAGRSAATCDEPFAPAQFQDLDDADEAVAAGVRAAARRASSCPPPAPQLRVGRDGQAGRPLRADHRSTRRYRAPPALPAPVRRLPVRALPRAARAVARSPLSQHAASKLQPFDGQRRRSAARRSPSRSQPTTRVPTAADVRAARRWRASTSQQTVAADPALAGALHVIPAFEVAAA